MAQRRMFNKSITNSSKFLKMPMSSRLLYYDLGMNADDDGFVEHFMVLRMTGATMQDLGVLELNGLIKVFDENVLWIKDWKENNYIQKDRYQPSKYLQMYTIEDYLENVEEEKKPLSNSRLKRLEAKKESNLPSTFENQIRVAFNGKKCPVCNKIMNFERDIDNPSIQHNVPISLGGKHEIDNISVICRSCNCGIQNKEITPPYNTEEVKQTWDCIGNVYTGKDSIGKISIDNIKENIKEKFKKPTLEEVESYCKERNNNVDPERFIDFYESKGWVVGKTPMKDWKACVRTWESKQVESKKTKTPKWFDNQNEIKETSKEEKEELNKILNEIENDK